MKGPHFFEKRKKEMARQEKLKQKAERKAQRKAEKDRGEGGETEETADEFGELADGGAAPGGEQQDSENPEGDGEKD
jgi:hypothetical protein